MKISIMPISSKVWKNFWKSGSRQTMLTRMRICGRYRGECERRGISQNATVLSNIFPMDGADLLLFIRRCWCRWTCFRENRAEREDAKIAYSIFKLCMPVACVQPKRIGACGRASIVDASVLVCVLARVNFYYIIIYISGWHSNGCTRMRFILTAVFSRSHHQTPTRWIVMQKNKHKNSNSQQREKQHSNEQSGETLSQRSAHPMTAVIIFRSRYNFSICGQRLRSSHTPFSAWAARNYWFLFGTVSCTRRTCANRHFTQYIQALHSSVRATVGSVILFLGCDVTEEV